MMDKSAKGKNITNEKLSKKFENNFDLVNYAISLAENMIKTGRETRVKSEVQNRAMLILEEINQGKDQFDDISEDFRRSLDYAHHPVSEDLKEEIVYEKTVIVPYINEAEDV
jgi:DNA-directed RNA polymerase subunit omega